MQTFASSRQEQPEIVRILDSYAPRVTYRVVGRPWWKRFFSHDVDIIVSGSDPYLAKAVEEVYQWRIDEQLRKAW